MEMNFQCVCVIVAWAVMDRTDKSGINTDFLCVNVILLWCARMTKSDIFHSEQTAMLGKIFFYR